MAHLEETYQQLEELKRERRELNKMFKDELSQHDRYQELVEEMKTLREEKKSIENEIRSASLGDADRIDEIKAELTAMMELLSDLALNKFMNDESIEITDEYNNRFVPVFSVKFKKA